MSFLAALMVSCKDEDANAPLKADFEESAAEVLVGDEVTFTDISTGSPTKWNWTFDGAETETSILSQPVVRWLKTGTFTVRLSVSRKDESSELVKEKLVHVGYHTSVKADFTMDKKMAFDNQEVTFTNKSTGFPETSNGHSPRKKASLSSRLKRTRSSFSFREYIQSDLRSATPSRPMRWKSRTRSRFWTGSPSCQNSAPETQPLMPAET